MLTCVPQEQDYIILQLFNSPVAFIFIVLFYCIQCTIKNKNKNKNIYLSFSRHTNIIENAVQQTQFRFVCNISMELTGTLARNICTPYTLLGVRAP